LRVQDIIKVSPHNSSLGVAKIIIVCLQTKLKSAFVQMDWDGALVDRKINWNMARPKRRKRRQLEIGYGFQEQKYITR
jgi:hypothetical protein